MKRKIVALLLVAVFLVGSIPLAHGEDAVWDGSIATGFASGTGTEADPYIIKTAEELAYLAASVNAGTRYAGKYIRLEADILLNDTTDWESWGSMDESGNILAPENEWAPIGSYISFSDVRPFSGIFDGNGHTVAGIYINTHSSYVGLFGYVNNGTVKNVGVIDSYICSSGRSVGGVCGENHYGTIKGCYNTGAVTGKDDVGGVCGASSYRGIITNCHNTGAVSGDRYVGGVCGENSGTIEGCYNTGAVTASGNYHDYEGCVGGVCGENYGGTIKGCYNTGAVSGSGYVGGVVGYNHTNSSTATGTVENCYNTGAVTGSGSYVGGVVGHNGASYYGIATVTNCYNTGAVTGKDYVGGVVGRNYAKHSDSKVIVKNYYYLSGTAEVGFNNSGDGTITIDNVTALSDAQMCVASSFVGFDFDTVWTMDGNADYPYPELRCHHVGEWITISASTCATNGTAERICSVCGASETEELPLDPTNHEGETEICNRKPATCTAAGYTGDTHCIACGVELETGKTIPALGHGETAIRDTKAATCTSAGYTGDTYCKTCGEKLEIGKTITALDHDWDEGKVTTNPACTTAGVKTYTCKRADCSETKTETVPATGHDYKAEVTAPTCAEAGYTTYTCSVCDESYVGDETPATGAHPWGEWEITTPATATADGEETRICTVCGKTETKVIPAVGFEDVPEKKYYYNAVMWAANVGITGGVDDTHFAPNNDCTRAQAVMFLWNAAGKPAVAEGTANPFVDVSAGKFYTDAVLWAVEQGITAGVDAAHFAPNRTVTRSEFVTFLYRAKGSPNSAGENPFADVPEKQFYTDAVLWAVEAGITTGVSATRFAPGDRCTRAQVTAFLYRAAKESS